MLLRFLDSPKAIWQILCGHFIVWLGVSLMADVHPDMADHWVWSRDLAAGYVIHPPMVAWSMRLATLIGGDHILTLKIGSVLFSVLILWLAYQVAILFYSRRVAILYLLILESTAYFSLGSIFWHIDQPYMVGWLLSLWTFGKFIQTKKIKWILLFGVCAGFGALGKYIMLLFYISLFLWCLFDRRQRTLFTKWYSYAAGVISLLVFSPNIYWNATHDWVSFEHQLNRGLSGSGDILGLFPQFTVGHLVLFSIIFSIWAWYALLTKKLFSESATSQETFLLATALTPFAFFTLSSFRASAADPHWLNITYFSLFLLFSKSLVQRLEQGQERKVVVGLFVSYFINFCALVVIILHLLYAILPLNTRYVNNMLRWETTAHQIETLMEENHVAPVSFVITREYQLSGALSLYLSFQPLSHTIQKAERNAWSPVDEVIKKGALFVCALERCRQTYPATVKRFRHPFKFLGEVKTKVNGKIIRHLRVYQLWTSKRY